MGQVRDIMFDSVYIKSKSRIVNNKCIHNSESVNWRADWSKFCNRSYAQVVKQNTQPKLQSQKCTKVISHPREISQAKNTLPRRKITYQRKRQYQVQGNQPRASPNTKIIRPKTAKAGVKEFFQLPVTNKFSVLSNNLQATNETKSTLNVNAPEYVPIASKQVKQKGQRTGKTYARKEHS